MKRGWRQGAPGPGVGVKGFVPKVDPMKRGWRRLKGPVGPEAEKGPEG
jgi:hypothetical protein